MEKLPAKPRQVVPAANQFVGQRRVIVAGSPIIVATRKVVPARSNIVSPKLGDVFGRELTTVRAECKDAFQVATESAKELLNKIRLWALYQEVTELIDKFFAQLDLMIANDPRRRSEERLLDYLEVKLSEIQYLSVLYFTTVVFSSGEITIEPQHAKSDAHVPHRIIETKVQTDACVSACLKGHQWIRSKQIDAIHIKCDSRFPEPNKPLQDHHNGSNSAPTPQLPKIIYPENGCFGKEWFVQFRDGTHLGELPLPDGTDVEVMGNGMFAAMKRQGNQWVYWPFDADANLIAVPLYGKTLEGFVDEDPTIFDPERIITDLIACVERHFVSISSQPDTYNTLSD